jgi:hypothetical protein
VWHVERSALLLSESRRRLTKAKLYESLQLWQGFVEFEQKEPFNACHHKVLGREMQQPALGDRESQRTTTAFVFMTAEISVGG